MTIPAGYQDSLAAYNTAVKQYDKLVGRFSPAELVVDAKKALVEAALKLAADVRITHEND